MTVTVASRAPAGLSLQELALLKMGDWPIPIHEHLESTSGKHW